MVEDPPASRGKRPGQAGFTLLEVVLSISLGALVLGGATVGYRYAKRQMIISNQRLEVNAFKALIENMRAAKAGAGTITVGPSLTPDQMCSLVSRLPSMLVDPFTSKARVSAEAGTAACAGTGSATASTYMADTMSGANFRHDSPPIEKLSDAFSVVTLTGSTVFYMACDHKIFADCLKLNGAKYEPESTTFRLVSGSDQTVYGYAIFTTDSDGKITALAGGDKVILDSIP